MLDYPQVALDFMNHDHAEFLAWRDRLLELLAAPTQDAQVDTLLNELLTHTRRHFAEEERLMQETHFPPYGMHKGEHERVLSDMAQQVAKWQQDHDAAVLRAWLDRDVGEWFVTHVKTMDFVTAGYIAMRMK